MKIITVTGYKGGVGKSTTAVHIATYFSDRGRTVLVDGDPNRTALGWAERGELPFTVADERQAMKIIGGADFVIIDTDLTHRPRCSQSAADVGNGQGPRRR